MKLAPWILTAIMALALPACFGGSEEEKVEVEEVEVEEIPAEESAEAVQEEPKPAPSGDIVDYTRGLQRAVHKSRKVTTDHNKKIKENQAEYNKALEGL